MLHLPVIFTIFGILNIYKKMTRSTYRLFLIVALILWTALVLYGSLATGIKLPRTGWLGWLARHDEVVHFFFYMGEVLFLLLLLVNIPAWGKALFVLNVILLSGMIEMIQGQIGRSRDINDFLANTLGACAGALAAWGINAFLRRYAPQLIAAG